MSIHINLKSQTSYNMPSLAFTINLVISII